MQIKEIMSKKVAWVPPTASLQTAAQKMRDLNVGCLPVEENERVVGMLTDRDIACRAVADGRDPSKVTVRDIMSSGIMSVFEDQDVKEAALTMEQKRVHRLPVLDRGNKVVGLLSLSDLALHAPRELSGEVMEVVSRQGGCH